MAPNLTERDVQVLAAAFQCLKSPPDIDYDKFAEKAGYKNATSAKVCFREIKKKLVVEGDEEAAPKKRTPAKKPTKKRTKTVSSDDSDDEKAPKKKTKAAKAKIQDDDAEETAIKQEDSGMNLDEGEDEGLTAEQLVKRESGIEDDEA